MTDFMDDIAAEAVEQTSSPAPANALETLNRLADEALQIESWLERAQEKIEERKKRYNAIMGREMVDIMDNPDVQMDKFTSQGRTFDCGNFYHASIPEEHRDEGHNWLEENEFGDLIKREMTITLPKDSYELEQKIRNAINQLTNEAEIETKRSVPWKRLTSWVKDYIETVMPRDKDAPPLPLEILGARVGRYVKLKAKPKTRNQEQSSS